MYSAIFVIFIIIIFGLDNKEYKMHGTYKHTSKQPKIVTPNMGGRELQIAVIGKGR
jgi:hypothetical protein